MPGPAAVGSTREAPAASGLSDGPVVSGLVLLTAALAVPYALFGANFVLDDWFMVRNTHFDGAFAGAGLSQTLARPGQWVVYVVEFGMLGGHPLAVYLLQAAVRCGVVVVLFVLFRQWLTRGQAAAVAAVWALFPNASSLEFWATCLNVTVSLLLLAAGALLLARSSKAGWSIGATICLVGSVLAYEATLPMAVALVVVVPLIERRFRWRPALAGWAALGAAGLWIVVNWSPAKTVRTTTSDFRPLFDAHFGWGVFPPGPLAMAGGFIAAVLIAVALGRLLLPSWKPGAGAAEWLVVAGIAVIALGTIPWVRYFYSPLGAGDRVNVVSSVGAAMAWVGIGLLVLRWSIPLAAAGAVTFVVLTTTVRIDRAATWAAAGEHVLDLLAAVDVALPHPSGEIILGPEPWEQDNISGLLDKSNVDAALQVHRDDRAVSGYITFSEQEFMRYPVERRFDLRGLSTYPAPPGAFHPSR